MTQTVKTVTQTVAAPATHTSGTAASSSAPARGPVSRAQAIAIASHRVGGGHIVKAERDDENDQPVWKVKLTKGNTEYKVDVALSNGKIVKLETDNNDSNNNDD